MKFPLHIKGRTYVLAADARFRGHDPAPWRLAHLVDGIGGEALHSVRSFLYDHDVAVHALGDRAVREELLRRLIDGRARLDDGMRREDRVLEVLTRPGGRAPDPAPPPMGPMAPIGLESAKKFRLVELVELVDRGSGAVGYVGGPAGISGRLPKLAKRDSEGRRDPNDYESFKQFINLDPDHEGRSKRHPEYGRYLNFRARLEWTDGTEEPKVQRKVKWSIDVQRHSTRELRSLVGRDEAGYWTSTMMTYLDTSIAKWDGAAGWIADTRVRVPRYAGDRITVFAEIDPEDANADPSSPRLRAGQYLVWHRFWYQITHFHADTVPSPEIAATAFHNCGIDMIPSDVVEWGKGADVPPKITKTFYKEWMIRPGTASDDSKVVINDKNMGWFVSKLKKRPHQPAKAHLIIGDDVVRSEGHSQPQFFQWGPERSKTVTLALPDPDLYILSPAPDGHLVRYGNWWIARDMVNRWNAAKGGPAEPHLPPRPARTEGAITDKDVDVPRGTGGKRDGLDRVKVTLPPDCPDPARYDIYVGLSVAVYARSVAGFSNEDTSAIPIEFDRARVNTYNNIVAHELGHVCGIPRKSVSKSLDDHPHVYSQDGEHCWFGGKPRGAHFVSGDCIMFESSKNHDAFCPYCEKQLRLKGIAGHLK